MTLHGQYKHQNSDMLNLSPKIT